MQKSESIKNIGAALMKFHQEVGKIKKEGRNPFFNNAKYANLPTILESIKEPLNTAGLVVTQFPSGQNGMTTLIMHPESGEFLEDSYNINPKGTDPQSLGSAITYARRYSLGAVLCLITDEDDDGNAATGLGNKQAAKATMTPEIFESTKASMKAAASDPTIRSAKDTFEAADKAMSMTPTQKAELQKLIK